MFSLKDKPESNSFEWKREEKENNINTLEWIERKYIYEIVIVQFTFTLLGDTIEMLKCSLWPSRIRYDMHDRKTIAHTFR